LHESGQHEAAHAEAVIDLDIAEQKGYGFVGAMALMTSGASQSEMGKADSGLARVQEGISIWRSGDNALSLSYYFSLLARAEHRAGHLDAALAALGDGFETVDAHGEYFWKSELHRLNGLWLAGSDTQRARWHLERSVDAADAVGAIILRLRSRVALAALLHSQHENQARVDAALDGLRDVFNSLPAQTDDPALAQARELLGLPALSPRPGAGGANPGRRA
jgi:predicted ATPase